MPLPAHRAYSDTMEPLAPTPALHTGPEVDTLDHTKITSFVAFDVTIHPARESSGPEAAANSTVEKDFAGETPIAIGAA